MDGDDGAASAELRPSSWARPRIQSRGRRTAWLWILTFVRMTGVWVGRCVGAGARDGRGHGLGLEVFSRKGGSPVWTPAFAGSTLLRLRALSPQAPPRRRPGFNWGTVVAEGALRYCDLSNWAPAFAGVAVAVDSTLTKVVPQRRRGLRRDSRLRGRTMLTENASAPISCACAVLNPHARHPDESQDPEPRGPPPVALDPGSSPG